MKASKGGLTHDQILKLTWRQFGVYLDAFTWLVREESEEGRQQNQRDDLRAAAKVPELREAKRRMVEADRKELQRHKKFAESKPTGGVVHDMLVV